MNRFLPFLISVFAGFGVGWLSAPADTPNNAQSLGRGPAELEREAVRHRGEILSSLEVDEAFEAPLDSIADCQAALEKAESLAGADHPLVIAALRDRALRRWLELDAESALGFAEGEVRSAYTAGIAEDLFRVWLDLDVDSALDSFAQASPLLVKAARNSFFSNLAQIDPRRAVEELAGPRWDSSIQRFDRGIKAVFEIWAAKDPREAFAAAKVWKKEGESFNRPLTAVAEKWAQSDPAAAWAEFSKLEMKNKFSGNTQKAIIGGYLLEKDPTADIGELTDRAQVSMVVHWANRNPESAIAFARERPADDLLARQLRWRAAGQLSTSEPERALDLIRDNEKLKNYYEFGSVVRPAFASLAATDFKQSLELLETLPGNRKSDALTGIITHQHATDPALAIAYCRQWLEDPSMSEFVLPAISGALSWGRGGGARDLGEILAEIPELGDHLDSYNLEGWVKTNPESAAEFIAGRVAERGGTGIEKDERAVAELGFSRPEFTSGWLSTLPEGDFRNVAAAALAVNWSRFNPEAADGWISGLPEGAMKSAAREAVEKEVPPDPP